MPRLHLPPVPVFVTMTVIGEMAFMTFATMASVYCITEAQLAPLQLMLVGTVLELSVLLAGVPTGVIADVDRLWAKHALETFEFPRIAELDPIVWFGVAQAPGRSAASLRSPWSSV